jgi:predicted dehydrogenase
MELYGDKGGMELEPELGIYTERNDYLVNISPVLTDTAFNFQDDFNNEINHFVNCIKNGEKCITPVEDGLEIMKILDAVYESSKTGQMILI